MREPAFWWRRRGAAAAMLMPAGVIYGAVAAARMRQPGPRVGIPVVCVGNFTLGGTGKTPAAIAIARILQHAGELPAFLSRGYGGALAGPLQVDATRHLAADVGDEPLLLARVATTIVAHDRVAGAELARAAGARVIVMDDGLQNPSLAKTVALAVVDGRRGIGNGLVFPAGPLRAPFAPQADRVQAILVLGDPYGAPSVLAVARTKGIWIFRGRVAPDPAAVARLRALRVLAFAGIGDPAKFFATLDEAQIDAPVRQAFADHHRYTRSEADAILKCADAQDLVPVTTEKDMARMAGVAALRELAARTQVLPVVLALDNPDQFRQWLMERLRAA